MATIALNVAQILKLCNTIVAENQAAAAAQAALASKVATLETEIQAIKVEVDQIKVNTDTPPTGDVVVSQEEMKALSDKLTSGTGDIKAFDESILKEK